LDQIARYINTEKKNTNETHEIMGSKCRAAVDVQWLSDSVERSEVDSLRRLGRLGAF